MVEITALREEFDSRDSTDIGWLHSEDITTDGLTKSSVFAPVEPFFGCGNLALDVAQWVVRSPPDAAFKEVNFLDLKKPGCGTSIIGAPVLPLPSYQ